MDKEKIIKNAHPIITASIMKYAISKGEFEDLYQEGIVHILESLNYYDEAKGVKLFAYLKSRLKYFYLNYGRYKKDMLSLNERIDEGIELIDLIEDKKEDIECSILEMETIGELKRAYNRLEDEEKMLINMLVFEGRTLDEVSRIMKISRTTVFRRREGAFEKLRNFISEK